MKKVQLVWAWLIVTGLPVVALAQGGGPTQDTKLPNPLANNVSSIYDLLALILERVVLPIGTIIIVFMIIYAGFKFVTARGNPEKISDARNMLFYILIGAAILLGAEAIALVVKGTLCQLAPNVPYLCGGSTVR